MIWLATVLSSLITATGFAALWLQRRRSADLRRSTCICAILGCSIVWLLAFTPASWFSRTPALISPSLSRAIEAPARPLIERFSPSKHLPNPLEIQPRTDSSTNLTTPINWEAGYGVGVIVVIVMWFGGWIYSLALARSGRLASELSPTSKWRTRLIPNLQVPASLGWPCRSILLPASAENWEPTMLNVVLRHEESHLQRRDHVWINLAQLLCALQWFNPLAWLLASRLRLECERVADDSVLSNGVKPSAYAEVILAFQGCGARSLPIDALQPLYRKSTLAQRLESILSPTTEHNAMNRNKSLAIATAVVCGITLVSALALSGWKQKSAAVEVVSKDQPQASGQTAHVPFPQYSLPREIQILQIGVKLGNKAIVWDPNGNLVPQSQIIDHDWNQNVTLAVPVDHPFRQLAPRFVVFRVEARPDDVTPKGIIENNMPERTSSTGRDEIEEPVVFLKTVDGWHYFVQERYITFPIPPKGPHSLPPNGEVADDETGLYGLTGSAFSVKVWPVKPVDEGSIKTLNLFSDWTAVDESGKLPEDGLAKANESATWSKVQFTRPAQVWYDAHFFTKGGKQIPASLVAGEFVERGSVNHKIQAIYHVGVAPSEIGDIRVSTRQSVDAEFTNVPMSPNQGP